MLSFVTAIFRQIKEMYCIKLVHKVAHVRQIDTNVVMLVTRQLWNRRDTSTCYFIAHQLDELIVLLLYAEIRGI